MYATCLLQPQQTSAKGESSSRKEYAQRRTGWPLGQVSHSCNTPFEGADILLASKGVGLPSACSSGAPLPDEAVDETASGWVGGGDDGGKGDGDSDGDSDGGGSRKRGTGAWQYGHGCSMSGNMGIWSGGSSSQARTVVLSVSSRTDEDPQ